MTDLVSSRPTDEQVLAAVARAQTGDAAEARLALSALWAGVGEQGDALQRCLIAHDLADLQDDTAAELDWDRRALDAVGEVAPERAPQVHPTLRPSGFLPSLHLNLADDLRRLGRPDEARHHLELGEQAAGMLGADPYGELIRSGLRRQREALAAGSRDPVGRA